MSGEGSIEGPQGGRGTAVLERTTGQHAERRQSHEPSLSRSRIQSELPRDKDFVPMTEEEKANAQKLEEVLGLEISQIVAIASEKHEKVEEHFDDFEGDLLWFMGKMRRQPLVKWSPEALAAELRKWEDKSRVFTPRQQEIQKEIVQIIRAAAIEKEKRNMKLWEEGSPEAQRPGSILDQILYDGPLPPLKPVRSTFEPGRLREEMAVEWQETEEQRARRSWRTEEEIHRREEEIKKIKDKRKREEEERALRRAEGLVSDIVTSFGERTDMTDAERQRLALSLGRRKDGYGAIRGEFGGGGDIGDPEDEVHPMDGWKDYDTLKREFIEDRPSWHEYGWSDTEKRNLRAALQKIGIRGTKEADTVLAAVLLHGHTAEELGELIYALDGKDQFNKYNLGHFLEEWGVMRNDDDVLNMLYTHEQRTQYLEQLSYREPQSFEDLAYQIVTEARTNTIFKRGQAKAILRNVVKEDESDGIKKFKLEEHVDADNIMLWLMHTAMEAHGNATTSPLDFEQQVQVKKSGMSIPITIYEMMLGRTGNMFKSKYRDHKNGWVADHLEALAIILSETRNSGIQVQQAMGDAKQLGEHRFKELVNSNMTRDVGGTSLLELMLKISERNNRKETGDGKIGATILTTYLAYCNLSNLEGLAETLGFIKMKDGKEVGDVAGLAEIFSLDKIQAARDNALRGRRSSEEGLQRGDLQNPDKGEGDDWLDLEIGMPTSDGAVVNKVKIRDIFDEHGKPRLHDKDSRKKFIQFINFFTHVTPDARLESVIRGIISSRASEVHGVRETQNGYSIPGQTSYAEMIAHGMMYRFGMYFYLDNSMSGRSEEGKLNMAYLRDRIKKDAHAGNGYALGLIPPHWLLPEALVVSTTAAGPDGKPMNMQNALIEAHKTRMRMDLKLNAQIEDWIKTAEAQAEIRRKETLLRTGSLKPKDGETEKERNERERKIRKTAEAEVKADRRDYLLRHEAKDMLQEYNKATQRLKFTEAAEKNYYNDHYQKGFSMDDRFTGAHGLEFDAYIKNTDPMTGPTIDMQKWVKDAAKFFNQMRKYHSGTNIFYGTMIPVWNEEKGIMESRPIGETMIGKQILSQILKEKKFWKNEKIGGEIDWEKINTDGEVHKWMQAGFIVGQILLYTERSEWNLNPRYSYQLRETILQAIARIPGDFVVDPDDARGSKATKRYFKKQMKWIRKASGTTWLKSFFLEALANIMLGSPGKKEGFFSGIAEAFAIMLKGIAVR